MTIEADRIETLIKNRIEQNRVERSDALRLAGVRFRPLQLGEAATEVEPDYQRQTWSLAEMLRYYDRQFVQNAYLVLLKREVDPDGLKSRLHVLRTGQTSRLELLFQLRYSPEGEQHKTLVKGLLRARLIERLYRLPLIGLIPRYLRALLYLPRMQRDIEELRGLIAMQKNDFDDSNHAIVEFQNEHLGRIVRHMNP
jgi:Domain of unknown function (DUF4214)